MVEAMYEQSPNYFKQFRKNYKFFILNHEPNFSGFASKANFAVSSHSNKLDFIFATIRLTTKNIIMCWSNLRKSLPIYLTR